MAHRAKGDRRRQQLVDIAAELFAQTGFRGTGLAAVADAAGVTPAGVLHYFGSKTGLLQAVLEKHYEGELPKLEQASRMHSPEGLIRIFEVVVEGLVDRPGLARLFSVLVAENLAPDDPAHANFVLRYASLRRAFVDWLERAKQEGSVRRDVDSDSLAVEMVAFMDGVQLQWLIDSDAVDLRACYRAYADGVLERIATTRVTSVKPAS